MLCTTLHPQVEDPVFDQCYYVPRRHLEAMWEEEQVGEWGCARGAGGKGSSGGWVGAVGG